MKTGSYIYTDGTRSEELDQSKTIAEGGRCPTIDELTGIFLNKDKINAALKAANLPELKESWYWSSTEYSSYDAWVLWMDDGYRSNYFKDYNYRYVRPVLAL